jgi:hypothetical protein
MAEAVIQEKYVIPRFVIPEGALDPKPEAPAEAKPTEPAPKPVEAATTTETKPEVEEGEDTETTGKDPESVKRSTRSYERRVDRALKQRAEAVARADRAERELANTRAKPQLPDPQRPKMENFTDVGEFGDAIEKYASAEAIRSYENKQRDERTQSVQKQLMQDWETKVTRATAKYDDFDEKVGELQPTLPWSRAIMRSENGDEVAYYLSNHRKEAEDIFKMDAESQYVEVGRLSQRLMQKVDAPKQTSKAPPPIAPVTGPAAVSGFDVKPQMPFEEYRKVGNKMFRGR